MSGDKYTIGALVQAGQILDVIAASREPITAAEIERAVAPDISKGTVFRTLRTLEAMLWIEESARGYDLGMKVARIWARKKSRLEARREEIDTQIKELEV